MIILPTMRGVLRRRGPLKVYANGNAPGVPHVQTQFAPSVDGTAAITIPGVGYAGKINIFLAGHASLVGAYWNPDGYGGPQASGEIAGWQYQCLGDETSFSLVQTNINASSTQTPNDGAPRLAFRVNGGVNNGKELRVGSGAGSGGYGSAGCPVTHANTTFASKLTATLLGYGASRYYNSTIYYSDNTQYSPADHPSYGSGTYIQGTYNGVFVEADFNYSSSSTLQVGGNIYNNPPVKSPYDHGGQSGRPGNSIGGVALIYLNDQ